ncbi:MAG: exodeoxyribonuclease III [Burkholderiaceae bacterium]
MQHASFKLTSLNLNGIRSAMRKGLAQWVQAEAPDCMCVQELKAQADDLDHDMHNLAGMRGYFHFAEKKGYAGVGVYSRAEPSEVRVGFGDAEFDAEGRYLEVRFDTPARRLSVISLYLPSGSSGDERQQAKYRCLASLTPHLAGLLAQREVLMCGDLNIAHQHIDLKNWRSNLKNSGCLPPEREWLSATLQQGMVDVYRHLYPNATDACYTWWSNRGQAWANNVGWRLDYQLATPALAQAAQRAEVYKAQRFSDHAPLTVWYARAS